MWKQRDIRVLHIEPTDVCQARCPSCARETDTEFDARRRHHLRVDDLEDLFDTEDIKRLHKLYACGNYGDPAAGLHTQAIFEWARRINPDIVLGMNTNGGIQSTFWWHQLARILSGSRDYVVFSIDGLEDTNEIYRRGVSWRRLQANIEAFVAAGGSAHWDMLVYAHNEHQVDLCQQRARDLGFRWFRAKVSRRPVTAGLQVPHKWNVPQAQPGVINCFALRNQEIYVDAQARVSPCCWLGSRQSRFVKDFDAVQASWLTTTPDPVCAATCQGSHTQFDQQWQREVELC
jgi:hypothetical protein